MANIPVRLPLKDLYIGDTYEFVLIGFKQLDSQGSEVPIDLTIYDEIKMSIRQRNERGPKVATLSTTGSTISGSGSSITGSGFRIEGDNDDELRGRITSEQTKGFRQGLYIFDIQFRRGDTIQTWFKDTINAEQEVTL
jgi:hypothetical protein